MFSRHTKLVKAVHLPRGLLERAQPQVFKGMCACQQAVFGTSLQEVFALQSIPVLHLLVSGFAMTSNCISCPSQERIQNNA